MRVTLYCGQTTGPQFSGSPEDSSYTLRGTAEEVIRLLQEQIDSRYGGSLEASGPLGVEAKVDMADIELLKQTCQKLCECIDIGQDGTKNHTPFSEAIDGVQLFQHPDSLATVPACMNHWRGYKLAGWRFVSRMTASKDGKLCQYCCSRERFLDTKTGQLDIFCEECISEDGAAMGARHKKLLSFNPTLRQARCLNFQQGVTGCVVWALPDEDLCAFCKRQKIVEETTGLPPIGSRPFTSSTPPKCRVHTLKADRPCILNKGCRGTMHATIRTYRTGESALWWFCPTCHQQRMAESTQATVDPRVTPALSEAEENKRIHDALNTFESEAHSQGEHISSILKEGRLD